MSQELGKRCIAHTDTHTKTRKERGLCTRICWGMLDAGKIEWARGGYPARNNLLFFFSSHLLSHQPHSCTTAGYQVRGWCFALCFRPWTHISDDSYIYQLSLDLATATTVSFVFDLQGVSLVVLPKAMKKAAISILCRKRKAHARTFFRLTSNDFENKLCYNISW